MTTQRDFHYRHLTFLIVFAGYISCSAVVSAEAPSAETLQQLQSGLNQLQSSVEELTADQRLQSRNGKTRLADVAVFAKAVDWMLRHNEFPQKNYDKQAAQVIELGQQRAIALKADTAPWELQTGMTVRGYVSRIDGSVQPYALTLPEGINPTALKRWPMHVRLHGRANDMNEVNFISRHENKPLPEDQTWIQLDVFGRGNNAYRWAGETDIFEAISDVRRRFRIDENRITLHGFSMGGAGAWHLGLHYPALWCSVGPGAGFVDFYKYQNKTSVLPPWQHATLGIYDAIDYSLNAANVPVCTYGGENDPQLVASTSVVEAAKQQNVDIKLLIGPGMGHKFHPDSFAEFMAFHQEKSMAGRQRMQSRRHIRFTTRTMKYNSCDWATIEEMQKVYEPCTLDARLTEKGDVEVTTNNIAVLSLSRDAGTWAVIDGEQLPCYEAAEGLLPSVYFEKTSNGWRVLDYDESKSFLDNPDLNKRHGLQGPIDDAFMEPFVCVTGTGSAMDAAHEEWSRWTLKRFKSEFDKWMRGRIRTVTDQEVTDELIAEQNLVLFGDPGSNLILGKILPQLPIQWKDDVITVAGRSFSTKDHGISMIYPNPLNPRKYLVINSGHTMHEKDFVASNAWLFPRLGDIAVQKFTKDSDGGFSEESIWADNFNSGWLLNAK